MGIVKNLPMVLMAVALVMVGGGSLAGMRTQATFTDTAAATATFTSGSVDLDLSTAATDCTAAAYADSLTNVFNVATGIPGDLALVNLCIKDTGTLPFRWDLSSAVTNSQTGADTLRTNYFVRVWQHSDNTTACVQRLNANGTDIALGAGEVSLLGTTAASGALTIAAAAATQVASGGFMKVCIGGVLDSDFNDTDADAAATAQNKTLSFTFTFRSNTF